MLPNLPRTMSARHRMWDNPATRDIVDQEPMEPASHLDEKDKGLLSRFHGVSGLMGSRFGLSRDTDRHWFPVRPLGAGTFGGVAVWERRDGTGEVVEETALKQAKYKRSYAFGSPRLLAQEAGIMYQLNEKESENIVYMKKFKVFRNLQREQITWRFYFEYCPYGDLGRLAMRYKAWGEYLPEEFLWLSLHSMALVAKIMADGQYKNLETAELPELPYHLIHSDIKPVNIFLGYNTNPKSPWHKYPVIKVGDWGMALLTNEYDPKNPRIFTRRGTPYYLPPESRADQDIQKYRTWRNPPFNRASIDPEEAEGSDFEPDYTDRKTGLPHNIWAIGMTMYELMAHTTAKPFSDLVNNLTEDQYVAWGENTIPVIKTQRNPEYDLDLRKLVRKCLNLRPSLRPTPDAILQVTWDKLRKFEIDLATSDGTASAAQQAESTEEFPRMYFRENEINDMPMGPHMQYFGWTERHLARYVYAENQYAAPVWGPLQHPQASFFEQEAEILRQEEEERRRARQSREG